MVEIIQPFELNSNEYVSSIQANSSTALTGAVTLANGTNITLVESGNTITVNGAPGMSIGGSITSATQGSVLYAGTAGLLSQDNANFFWDSTNHRLGIGTTSLPSMLTVNGLINMKNYTVATLPAGTQGDICYVTDALAPSFLTIIVGGGTVKTPVFFNGVNWVGF